MAQIKFTYSTETFYQRKNEDAEPEYLGTYDMVKKTISEGTIDKAMKNAGQWVDIGVQIFTADELREHWGNGKPIDYNGTLYRVGKMSYGDYFLEPYNPKYPLGKGERKPFEKGTLWLEKIEKDPYHYKISNPEEEIKKKIKHLGDVPKKIKHLDKGPSLTDPKAYDLFLNLKQFTGSENWYKHPLSGYTYTDGVKYLAEKAEAYWLIDKILITTKHIPKLQLQEYQEFTSWKLIVNDDRTATLIAEDGNGHKIYSEKINYTDFPLKEINLWFENGTLILPSEH